MHFLYQMFFLRAWAFWVFISCIIANMLAYMSARPDAEIFNAVFMQTILSILVYGIVFLSQFNSFLGLRGGFMRAFRWLGFGTFLLIIFFLQFTSSTKFMAIWLVGGAAEFVAAWMLLMFFQSVFFGGKRTENSEK